MNGTIHKIDHVKGFGFIQVSGGGRYFFHRSDVSAQTSFHHLNEGDSVLFDDVKPAPEKGPRAKNVEPKA